MATNDISMMQVNAAGKWLRRTIAPVAGGFLKTNAVDAALSYNSMFVGTGSSAVVSSTDTETTIVPSGIGSLTLAGGTARVGSRIRGIWSAAAQRASGTLLIRLKLGSYTVLGQSVTPNANDSWGGVFEFVFMALGAGTTNFLGAGTMVGSGQGYGMSNTTGGGALDSTGSLVFDLTATHSISSAGNAIYGTGLSLDFIY